MSKTNGIRAGFIPYGGLGNQLFQFAATLSLMTDENRDLELDDIDAASKNVDGNPEILDFEIEKIVNLHIRKLNSSRTLDKFITLQLRLSNKILSKRLPNKILNTFLGIFSGLTSLLLGKRVLSPNGLGWDEKLKPTRRDFTLLGNFHSYMYIDDKNRSKLRNGLKCRNSTNEIEHFEKTSVIDKPTAIHIRLGDYLLIDELNVVSREYFDKAVEIIESKNPKSKYWIFTNDRELSEKYLPERIISRCDFIPESMNSAQTLEIMRLCENYIISNSTFSWWGAFLSRTDNPIVIAPKNWFKTVKEPRNICLPEWIRI